MPINNFNPEAFAKDMAQQAIAVLPNDLNENHKEYIINKVFEFGKLAADALNQDPNILLTCEQAQLVTQFIQEWTFHKSIDIIKGNVPEQFWDHILQQVAFGVFQQSKDSIMQGLDHQGVAQAVENVVNITYQNIVNEMVNSGVLNKETAVSVLNQSNLDEMAKNTYSPDVEISEEEKNKALKYASVAILLNSMSPERRKRILSNLGNSSEIKEYLQDENITQNVSSEELKECLNDIKEKVTAKKNEPSPINYISLIKELGYEFSEKEVYDLVKFERKKINNFVSLALDDSPTKDMMVNFSEPLAKIIYNYLKAKLHMN